MSEIEYKLKTVSFGMIIAEVSHRIRYRRVVRPDLGTDVELAAELEKRFAALTNIMQPY